MKKEFISLAAGCVFTLFTAGTALAQVQLPEITVTESAKSNISNTKVTSSFENSFKNVSHVKWYESGNRYLVNFMTEDLRNHVLYTKKGQMIYHIIYGFEKNLPSDLLSQVKGQYKAYSVIRAINVKQGGANVWMVNLENAKGYVMLRMADGDMNEVRTLKKTMPSEVRASL
ncbi:hypothetical protein NF867_04915 [Solitalea sp. MAHUQ-68]|uniref:Beta-lactamase-inhibitor-like PepSY-like domain-containing protein n=1 Tax=Solitalea agri TaxID=2953739 RepID=A0A9X2F4J2_9SPHI|nr:hypothetical protein [Solitalea agri]MCO4292201.1 hypothetical protein [Solitalea agri]